MWNKEHHVFFIRWIWQTAGKSKVVIFYWYFWQTTQFLQCIWHAYVWLGYERRVHLSVCSSVRHTHILIESEMIAAESHGFQLSDSMRLQTRLGWVKWRKKQIFDQQILFYLHCVSKNMRPHFRWLVELVYCPNTKVFFSTPITKSMGYRQVYLVSHLTYLVQLLYFGKLSRPNCHEFSLKLLIFSVLEY